MPDKCRMNVDHIFDALETSLSAKEP
jgi:hypothetical protein